jgi:hypothetical protein
VARAISKCPQCGEHVSPFAAGCALCGADLDAARARGPARRGLTLPRPPGLARGYRIDWVHVIVAVVLALAVPPIGLLLALFWAYQRHNGGEQTMAFAMTAVAALALAALLSPVWFWSHLL